MKPIFSNLSPEKSELGITTGQHTGGGLCSAHMTIGNLSSACIKLGFDPAETVIELGPIKRKVNGWPIRDIFLIWPRARFAASSIKDTLKQRIPDTWGGWMEDVKIGDSDYEVIRNKDARQGEKNA